VQLCRRHRRRGAGQAVEVPAEDAVLAERVGMAERVTLLVGRQRRLYRQNQERDRQPQGPAGATAPEAAQALKHGVHGNQVPGVRVAMAGAGAGLTAGGCMAALAAASILKVMSCAISPAIEA